MRRILDIILQDRPIIIGASGTAWTVILERVHTVLGLLVGLATLVYLVIKIRKEWRNK